MFLKCLGQLTLRSANDFFKVKEMSLEAKDSHTLDREQRKMSLGLKQMQARSLGSNY